MKRSILFSFLFLVLTSSVFASTTEINLIKYPTLPGPKPLSVTLCPVTAFISEIELVVNFDLPVGNAIITVYDANDNVVSQETVNTNSTTTVTIDSSTWTSGNYTLVVTYGTTTLSGVFTIE